MDDHLSIYPMDESSARQVVRWSYGDSYSMYDMSEEDIPEFLSGSYYIAFDHSGVLVGFFCFGESAQVPAGRQLGLYDDDGLLDIGLGMDPALCGRGRGLAFLRGGMEWAIGRFRTQGFRLTVAAFNQRAATVYERAGFIKVSQFKRDTDGQETGFWVMVNRLVRPGDQVCDSNVSYATTPTSPGPE